MSEYLGETISTKDWLQTKTLFPNKKNILKAALFNTNKYLYDMHSKKYITLHCGQRSALVL